MRDELRAALTAWLASAGDDEGTEARLVEVAKERLAAQPAPDARLRAVRAAIEAERDLLPDEPTDPFEAGCAAAYAHVLSVLTDTGAALAGEACDD